MKTRILFIALIFSFLTTKAQDIPIGQWRVHVPYNRAIGVKVMGDEVYCLTTRSLFIYDRKTGEVETISKLDGLSGNLFSALGYNESQKCIIIGHEDGAIDLIKNDEIINVSDIKNAEVVNVKRINRIVCRGKYAYLCCEFGIVAFDVEKEEVRDTYRLPVNVWDLTTDDTNFYAATDEGILYVAQNAPLIISPESWVQMEIPDSGRCVAINYWKEKLVYYFEGTKNVYTQTPLKDDHTVLKNIGNPSGGKLDITVSNNQLLLSANRNVFIYSESYQSSKTISEVHLGDTTRTTNPTQAFHIGNNQYFIADNSLGLLFINSMNPVAGEVIQPNGPYSHRSFNMTTDGTKVWIASGGHTDLWAKWWTRDGFYCFDGYSWTSFNSSNGTLSGEILDISNITVHPQNKDIIYLGTWGNGLVEIKKGEAPKIYNSTNSPLKKRCEAPDQGEFVAGVAFDSKGVMWVANSNSSNVLLTCDKT
ncbi:MAG: hypothetical protein LBU83_04965 [Bacteroidales bacterium]|jgi:hypothetical protein|nr:hypothetical protein [Bacteroidales bacterium]